MGECRRVVVYVRRSSESEDRQILSIESQLEELRRLALSLGITIVEEFAESASARNPGRPVFNQLMKLVRERKGMGILVWRLDRLARNMVDGGAIIYELSRGKAERQLTTLTDLVVAGYITPEDYKVRRLNQLKRIEHLREALAEPIERLEAWKAARAEIDHASINFVQMFKVGTNEEKRALMTRVFSDVVVTNRIARPELRVPFTLLSLPADVRSTN